MKANNSDNQLKENLREYIPEAFVSYVYDLLIATNVKFRIVRPRKTKLGDFRISTKQFGAPQITINNDLNPYAFLITTLHEIAHLQTYLSYNVGVKAHGKEWKFEFQRLLHPLLSAREVPEELKTCLKNTIKNTRAASYSDIALSRVLRKFDAQKKGVPLEQIDPGAQFELNKKSFKKGKLRRTRYLCSELHTGKAYLIHALAEVNSK
ncbi:MAG: sprT domain-containing protein [Crocinitomicaceae bacterium]|nr:MAG: hypothetical protein CBB76_10500 [Crocinitomicaceae bacterium TMED16]|tara:strand:- start:1809 stop:2432 length:624 start_codon:yes stop_codon:yes gene_type:complete